MNAPPSPNMVAGAYTVRSADFVDVWVTMRPGPDGTVALLASNPDIAPGCCVVWPGSAGHRPALSLAEMVHVSTVISGMEP